MHSAFACTPAVVTHLVPAALASFHEQYPKASVSVTEGHLDKVLRPAMQSFLRIGPFPYPVCLFHFTMDDDQGYYTWVAEPAVTDAGPRLLMHETPHCRKLDNVALDEIVARVDGWYDAFFGRIAVKAS